MISFLKSLTPKTRILLAFILGGIVIFLFGITLLGFLSTRQSMERVNEYNVAIGLARQTDADFQLAISKGKNFAILKDKTNKTRTLDYFKRAQETFTELSKVEGDAKEKELLYRLGAGLHSVEFPLGILISTAKKSDSAEKLYSRYLKDITIDYDDASQAYVDYLEGEIHAAQSNLTHETQTDLAFALMGALLALVGMGISYSIANSLNLALQNETTLEERYRVLTEITEESIMIHDQGVVVDANPALARLLGYEIGEIIGQHVSKFSDASAAAVTEKYLREGYPKGSYEINGIRKDGSKFPLLVHGHDLVYKGRKLRASSGWDLTELKKNEVILKESQERFERFVEVTKEGIMLHENGIIVDVNQGLLEMTGLTAADLVGSDGHEFLLEESAELVRGFLAKGFPDKPYEITIRRKDKTLLPLEVLSRQFPFQGRNMRVASFWDITERKKAEQALQENQDRFQRFAEVTREGIMIHDQGTLVDANPALASMLGYEISEMMVKEKFSFLDPESVATVRRHAEENYVLPYEIRARRKDGSTFPAEIIGQNFRFNGKDLRVAAIWDITERKKAEEALRQSEAKFRGLIENSYDLITVADPQGRRIYESPSLERVLGYKPGERKGTAFDAMPPEEREKARKLFGEVLANPGVPFRTESRFQHKDGHFLHVEVVLTNLLNDPAVGGIVVNGRDVTAKVKAEEALRKSEEHFRNLIEKSTTSFPWCRKTG